MYQLNNDILLNRALLSKEADSRILRSGTALVHVFPELGAYEVAVFGRETPRDRFLVEVAAGAGPSQVTVDLVPSGDDACHPAGGPRHRLRSPGVVIFHQSIGSAPTSVTISRLSDEGAQTLVDSGDRLRQGEVYALTLARPGDYVMEDMLGDHRLAVRVVPMEAGPLRRPELVTLGDGGFEPAQVRLTAGQTLAVRLEADARLVTTSRETSG